MAGAPLAAVGVIFFVANNWQAQGKGERWDKIPP
jgi:uncharacterized membrane protein